MKVIKLENKETQEKTQEKIIDLRKPIEITLKLPEYVVKILERLSVESKKSKKEIISQFILNELEALTSSYEVLGMFFKPFMEEIEACVHDFEEDLKNGSHSQ